MRDTDQHTRTHMTPAQDTVTQIPVQYTDTHTQGDHDHTDPQHKLTEPLLSPPTAHRAGPLPGSAEQGAIGNLRHCLSSGVFVKDGEGLAWSGPQGGSGQRVWRNEQGWDKLKQGKEWLEAGCVCECVYVCVCVFKEAGWEGAGKNPVPHQSGNRLPQNQGRGPTPWQGCLASRGYL